MGIAIIMDGKKLAQEVKEHVKSEVKLFEKKGVTPGLATIMVGENPDSKLYVGLKCKACEEVGINEKNYSLPENIEREELIGLVKQLNDEKNVHGILLQLPLPSGCCVDSYDIITTILPEKDVDGLHPYNVGRLPHKRYSLAPCTPRGILAMFNRYGIEVGSKHVVIINRSTLVGRPLEMLLTTFDPSQILLYGTDNFLLNKDATVSVCHSKTQELKYFTKHADILITAVGQRKEFMVTEDMVKTGAVVVDVGITKIEGKVYGDVDFERVREKASYITPVPGGVGPMTVATLLYNNLIATSIQTGHEIQNDYLKKLYSV